MKNRNIILILAFSLLLISSCAYIGEICSQFLPEEFCRIITCVFGEEGVQNILNNQEARQFLQTHPDAEITITLIPKKNVLKNYNSLSNEFDTRPQIKDYIKLELKDGNDVLIALVDANTKTLNYVKLEGEKPKEAEKPVVKPTEIPKDANCTNIITYSCNSQGNPIEITNAYKYEYNKCKINYIRKHTLDICKDNEYCKEGIKTCLQKV